MILVDGTIKPPKITIIEGKGGRPKKKRSTIIPLTSTKCRHCGNELSDKAIKVGIDLCPDCGGSAIDEEFIAKHRD